MKPIKMNVPVALPLIDVRLEGQTPYTDTYAVECSGTDENFFAVPVQRVKELERQLAAVTTKLDALLEDKVRLLQKLDRIKQIAKSSIETLMVDDEVELIGRLHETKMPTQMPKSKAATNLSMGGSRE